MTELHVPQNIEFSMKTALPIIRKAYENEELQMFKLGSYDGCLYAGPCAIGSCIPKEQRAYYDKADEYITSYDETCSGPWSTAVDELYKHGFFSFDSAEEALDFAELQSAHDNATSVTLSDSPCFKYVDGKEELNDGYARKLEMIDQFNDLLTELEQKYL